MPNQLSLFPPNERRYRHDIDVAPANVSRKIWYREYLSSDAWQAKRLAVLRRAKYTCEGCGAQNVALDIHHKTYERVGNEFLWDLVAACRTCHAKVHGK